MGLTDKKLLGFFFFLPGKFAVSQWTHNGTDIYFGFVWFIFWPGAVRFRSIIVQLIIRTSKNSALSPNTPKCYYSQVVNRVHT